MNKVFLSASIPNKERNAKYFDTADIIAIRDSVRALATVVLPTSTLVWGGHPAITPLIRYVLDQVLKLPVPDHIILYQSEFFRKHFPVDNKYIETIVITPDEGEREKSLHLMRTKMISDHSFCAAIFIGGMDGVEIEYKMFKEAHPQTPIFPIASTGAAAKIIYDNFHTDLGPRLANDFAYMALFKALLKLS